MNANRLSALAFKAHRDVAVTIYDGLFAAV